MTAAPPLDLARLDPPVWRVASGDKVHGPFTIGQLQTFIRAEKIGPGTRIAGGDGLPFTPAREIEPLKAVLAEAMAARAARLGGASNYLIVARSTSGTDTDARRDVSRALNKLGRFTETMPGTFLLRSNLGLAHVRRMLAEMAGGPANQLFIVEVRDGRLGWLGLPEAASAQVRSVWNAPPA